MFFGFRLPGLFRVGVSSKGRVYGGVNLGPFSASTRLGGGVPRTGHQFWPVSMTEAIEIGRSEGWRVMFADQSRAVLRMGNTTVEMRPIQGGVSVRRLGNERTILWLIGGIVLTVAWCAGMLLLLD